MKRTKPNELAAVFLREVSSPITTHQRHQIALKGIYEVVSDKSKTRAERIREVALRIYLLNS